MSKEERKFIHDLANPIAIAQGNIKLTVRKLKKNASSLTTDEIIERLEKSCEAFDRMGELIEERRSALTSDQEGNEKAI